MQLHQDGSSYQIVRINSHGILFFFTKFIWLCLFEYKYILSILCFSAFKFHTRHIVLKVTMEQTVQLTAPVIQENVLLMGILTVKWVRLHTQIKQY